MTETTTSIAVSTITFLAQDGTCVFSGDTGEGKRIRAVARKNTLSRPPLVGEVWRLTGRHQTHPTYGKQLLVTSGRYEVPKGLLIVNYLVNNPCFSGIGQAKAEALYSAFGDDLVSILNAGEATELESVLSAQMAERLMTAWTQNLEEAKLIAFLDEHGFEPRLANKLHAVWGSQAQSMLESNPYLMLAFASWRKTDAAAMKLHIKRDDERRLIGAVEAALYGRLQDAHTVTPLALLLVKVQYLLGSKAANRAIALALAEGAITGSETEGYRPAGAAALEERIAERINAMLAGEQPVQSSFLGAGATPQDWLNTTIAENEASQGFPLNVQQRASVKMAATKPFSVLTGGAGVGKTTVLRVVIDVVSRMKLKVFQMALAGRAAKRMSEATNYPAMTIAKFLHHAKTGEIEISADSLVIVDEASMLDLPTMYRILKYLPDGCRLLLVGDSAQLPPIGFGLVFHRLVESSRIPKVELTEVHRQAAATGIPAIASLIRGHIPPRLDAYSGRRSGVSFIACSNENIVAELHGLAADWSSDDWQVLAAVKGGRAGIEVINGYFHSQHCGAALDGLQFGIGEPVVHLLNDYELGLMNGTLGRVVAVEGDEGSSLLVDFEGSVKSLPKTEVIDRLQLAYALSVHKAQGSQFQRVAVVITKSKVLDHALIYTALTRGIEQVVFVGDKTAFESAVSSPAFAHTRQVGFVI